MAEFRSPLGRAPTSTSMPTTEAADAGNVGLPRGADTLNAPVTVGGVLGDINAILGIKLKTGLTTLTKIKSLSMYTPVNKRFGFQLILNPTVAGAFTFGDYTTNLQLAIGITANTVTGGIIVASGYANELHAIKHAIIDTFSQLTTDADTLVLCTIVQEAGIDMHASLNWIEGIVG